MTRPASDRSDFPTQAAVFLGSCLVHGAFAWLAWAGGTGLVGDEASYLARAGAFSRILGSLFGGATVAASDLEAAYLRGIWPPLHPLLLSVVHDVFADPLLGARLWVAFLASLTTLVVYRLGARLFSRPAGWIAAGLHTASPVFLGFSHFLWSETLYVLLLLALFSVVLRPSESARPRREVLDASMAGALLGAMTLTRSSGAPFYLLLPLLWLGGGGRRRVLSVACFGILALGLAAPWHWVILQQEGRLLPFSTHASVQLYLGNNPFAADLLSYQTSQISAEQEFDRAIHEIQQQATLTRLHPSDAARDLALGFIRQDPIGFLRRSASRAAVLLSGDSFVLRHALAVVYPPLAPAAVVALFLWGQLFTLATFALGLAALLCQPLRQRTTLVGWMFVLASAAPPLLTLSVSRLGLPLLAVLLPYAGHGLWVCLRGFPGSRRLGALAAGIGVVLGANAAALLPLNYRVLGQPSSFHAPLLAGLDRLYPGETVYEDFFELHDAGPGGLELRLEGALRARRVGDDAASGVAELRWSGPGTHRIALVAEDVARPSALWLRRPGEAWVRHLPVREDAWRVWDPTPVPGVSAYWWGGEPADAPAPP